MEKSQAAAPEPTGEPATNRIAIAAGVLGITTIVLTVTALARAGSPTPLVPPAVLLLASLVGGLIAGILGAVGIQRANQRAGTSKNMAVIGCAGALTAVVGAVIVLSIASSGGFGAG